VKNILLLESVVEEAFQGLKKHSQLFTAYQGESIREITEKNDIHAIITRGKGQVNKALMESYSAVEVVARCGVGLDNVDVKEATAWQVKVINAPGVNAAAIAEHTLSLMLILIRMGSLCGPARTPNVIKQNLMVPLKA
jgi:D-3-phosphoglycerate dehydrogenase